MFGVSKYSHNMPVYGELGRYPLSRPSRNSFLLVVANLCYQVEDQVAKLILW